MAKHLDSDNKIRNETFYETYMIEPHHREGLSKVPKNGRVILEERARHMWNTRRAVELIFCELFYL